MTTEKTKEPVKELGFRLDEFIMQKQALGYKYLAEAKSLQGFLRFVEGYGISSCQLEKELIDAYGKIRPNETPKSRANRISDVRQFAKYLNVNGIEAHVPPPVKRTLSDFTPYIFTMDEINRIISETDSIKPHSRYNCADVYPVLFRILYGCGLRVSEALDIRLPDVDLDKGAVIIRGGKNNKSRLVAMSPSLTVFCSDLKQKIHKDSSGADYFFKNRDGSRRDKDTVYDQFRELLWKSDIPYRGKGYGPRLHDLRHSFCCHSLKQMSDAGIDLYCALPVLSAYVGHSSIKSTEKYLRLTEQFFPDIAARIESTYINVYPEVYRIETD